MADYTSTYIIDAEGNRVFVADAQARADIKKMKDLPIGFRIITNAELAPKDLPEGVWVLEDYHNFNGDYVYTRAE